MPIHSARRRGFAPGGEAGTSLLGSLAAVVVVLVLLLFAVQTTTALLARSTVSAAGLHAARQVAGRSVDHRDRAAVASAEGRAEAELRQLLGHLGEDAEISWSVDGGAVRLRIEASTPGLLPAAWAAGSLRRIDRTFVVRIEELR